MRLRDGAIKKIEVQSQYSIIKDYLAQRTYDGIWKLCRRSISNFIK
jgi:hypothetical protein